MATRKHSAARPAPSPPAPSLLADINERTLLDLVENQKLRLLNLTGMLRCMKCAMTSDLDLDHDEIERALTVADEQVQAVIDSLDEAELLRTARAQTASLEKTVARYAASRDSARGVSP
jgi:acetolactate synthase small subunit